MLKKSKKDNPLTQAFNTWLNRAQPRPKHTKLKKGAIGAGVMTAVAGAVIASSKKDQP